MQSSSAKTFGDAVRGRRDAAEAAVEGAKRMFVPVIASSLTTLAAFIPLMLFGGGWARRACAANGAVVHHHRVARRMFPGAAGTPAGAVRKDARRDTTRRSCAQRSTRAFARFLRSRGSCRWRGPRIDKPGVDLVRRHRRDGVRHQSGCVATRRHSLRHGLRLRVDRGRRRVQRRRRPIAKNTRSSHSWKTRCAQTDAAVRQRRI